jgi:Zn-dependent peptidase ImmA (M78 family)
LWESGERAPGIDDLLDLAQALNRPIGFFLPSSNRLPQEDRAVASLSLRSVASQLSGATLGPELQRAISDAEAMSPEPVVFLPRSRDPIESAQEILSALSTAAPPIDVERAARMIGARVITQTYRTDALSGFLLYLEDGPVIGTNAAHALGRRRFTMAHELGHLVLGHHADFHLDLTSSVHAGDPPGYDWKHERSANTFAANLLMPAGLIRQDWMAERQTPARLAKRYQVSQEAIGIRLASLGLT